MNHNSVNTRLTHPTFYRCHMTFATTMMLLALNFWFGPPPTFKPYNINFGLVGIVFFLLAASLFVFLNLYRNLRIVRLAMSVSIGFCFFWGVTNTQQVLAGSASWQIPILFLSAMCVANIWWFSESPVNPMTEKKQ